MQEKLLINNIKKELDLDNVHIHTELHYDDILSNENEFTDWRIIKAFDKDLNIVNLLVFNSWDAFNEEIGKHLINIRKKCIEKFNIDIIPLDYDMQIINIFHNKKSSINPKKKYILTNIKKFCKKNNLNLKYIICDKNGNAIFFIEHDVYHGLSTKVNKKLYRFINKYKYSIDVFEYFNINKDYSNRNDNSNFINYD